MIDRCFKNSWYLCYDCVRLIRLLGYVSQEMEYIVYYLDNQYES